MTKQYLGRSMLDSIFDIIDYIPEKDDKGLPLIHKDVCFTTETLIETISRSKEYLGDKKRYNGYVTITAKMVVREGINFEAFNKWWIKSIHDGTNEFHVKLPFFGPMEVIRVKFIDDLHEQHSSGARWTTVKLEVDIFNAKIVDKNVNYILSCDSMIECNAILECL